MKNYLHLYALLLLTFGTDALAQSPSEKGLTIMQQQENRDAGWDRVKAFGEMVLYDAAGRKSVRKFAVIRGEHNTAKEGDRSKIVFNSPADIRDTVLLTHAKVEPNDDDQWLFLPVVERVKRISSANRTGKFVSSEFSYEDMGGAELEDSDYQWLRDESCPGADNLSCHLVASFPRSAESGYWKRLTWLDTEEFRPLQTQFFNRNKAHEKTLTYQGYQLYKNRHWRPDSMKMINHQTGKRTDLNWQSYTFGVELPRKAFSPQALDR